MVRDSPEPLRAGAVYRRNAAGGRDVFLHIQETLYLRAEFGEVTVTTTDADDNVFRKVPAVGEQDAAIRAEFSSAR